VGLAVTYELGYLGGARRPKERLGMTADVRRVGEISLEYARIGDGLEHVNT
jgi:hypothetical protein